MVDEIKLLLGDAAANYTDAQINLAYKMALNEVEEYCNREADTALELVAERIAVIKLNLINTEGLAGQSYSGVSETYIDGYPADIQAILNRKRKIKVI
ncbi:MAG: phage head-tail connector protein [Romboutsia timonensis]